MPDDSDLGSVIQQLKSARVLCVGDVMLDHYVYGAVGPVSADRPEPVLTIDNEARRIGGGGNVLHNLAILGTAASFVSVVGDDDAGHEIERLLAAEFGVEIHLLVQPDRTTPVKSRFIAGDRQLLRADRESAIPLGPYIREDLLRLARELVTSHGAVIISDHAKGVLTDGVALEIIRAAREAGARVVVDPEGGDPIRYRGADLLMSSRRELFDATGMPVAGERDVKAAARALIDRCAFGAVLVSLGGGRRLLAEADGDFHVERTDDPDAAEAGGAEGAVVAIVAAGLGAGLPAAAAFRLAKCAMRLVGDAEAIGSAAVDPA